MTKLFESIGLVAALALVLASLVVAHAYMDQTGSFATAALDESAP